MAGIPCFLMECSVFGHSEVAMAGGAEAFNTRGMTSTSARSPNVDTASHACSSPTLRQELRPVDRAT